MKYVYLVLFSTLLLSCKTSEIPDSSPSDPNVSNIDNFEGFFDFSWDPETGRISLKIENFDEEFLYVNYLAAGVGSNDIGLDRGQIGNERVVRFVRSGNRVLLVQPNYGFRAVSDNEEEVRSVNEAFAQSVLWGFEVIEDADGMATIDITDFLLSDSHGVAERIKAKKQGTYSLDPSRSAMYLPMTKNFTDNTEFEATITFNGKPEGDYIKSVVPTPSSVTVRTHHSFVRLPDDAYEKLPYDPRSGYYATSYQDYASPIEESLVKQFVNRHRLQKKNPEATISEPVEPIIYYVDKGAPEPVLSALVEGAKWWNEAFEAAGYKDAFQVYLLPDSADPLDVNYNVIQWVHRSTRGWSYGSSVVDPRTGEIIKGHVSLGSLRIRQDFLIATGLIQPYGEGEEVTDEMLEMALARLRQLSAHEVGHTLGLYHNFAASVNDRASVMDYPHPYIKLDESGEIDLSDAYDVGIGEWDKYAIRYGYSDFLKEDESSRQAIITEWIDAGQQYIMDNDARPQGGAHASAHLWDNGENAAEELIRLTEIRKTVLDNFSERAIQEGEALSNIEEVLVPMYFLHRFQIEAASKLIGGYGYAYKVKGDKLPYPESVPASEQQAAITSLAETLTPEFLSIPDHLLRLLSPKAPGYGRTRESFKSNTGLTFDPVAAAETSAEMTLSMIFQPERIERVIQQNLKDPSLPGWAELTDGIYQVCWDADYPEDLGKEIKISVQKRLLYHLMNLAVADQSTEMTKALASQELFDLIGLLKGKNTNDLLVKAHYAHCISQYTMFLASPDDFQIPETLSPPDGSPIGSDCGN